MLPAWGAHNMLCILFYIDQFQFTLPAWWARWLQQICLRILMFQFTLPVWGAFMPLPCTTFIIKFQFTLPGWGALSTQRRIIENLRFNSRSPHEEHSLCLKKYILDLVLLKVRTFLFSWRLLGFLLEKLNDFLAFIYIYESIIFLILYRNSPFHFLYNIWLIFRKFLFMLFPR